MTDQTTTGGTDGPDGPPDTPPTIVDFDGMGRRAADTFIRVAGVVLVGAVIDGAINGLTFALLARWAGIFVVLSIASMAVLTAVHALRGADRANRQGQRLSSPDVGITPRRFTEGGLLGAIEAANAGRATPDPVSDSDDDRDDGAGEG